MQVKQGQAADPTITFRAALENQADDGVIARGSVLHGPCFSLTDGQHFALKNRISQEFLVESMTDVFVVGSAKLGFSIAPQKRWRIFGDHSDIDVAIVNHNLYSTVWHEVQAFKEEGALWPKRARFESYLAWGWIRPDLLPASPVFSFSNQWFEFFRELTNEGVAGPYKVAAALYHDISFLVDYQCSAIRACRNGSV